MRDLFMVMENLMNMVVHVEDTMNGMKLFQVNGSLIPTEIKISSRNFEITHIFNEEQI